MQTGRSVIPRTVLGAAVLAFGGSVVWLLLLGLDRVPGQFDAAGDVHRWDSTASFLGGLCGVTAMLLSVFGGARWYIPRIPASAINMPSPSAHAYWTSSERRGEFDDIVASAMELVGAAATLMMAAIVIVSGLTATGTTVPVWVFVALTVACLVAVLGCAGYIVARTRIPKGSPPPPAESSSTRMPPSRRHL